jgi:hypothetical protein
MSLRDLTDEELAVLIAYVRDKLAAERLPYSPALRPVKSAMAKLGPPAANPEPFPAPKPAREPSHLLAKRRRR